MARPAQNDTRAERLSQKLKENLKRRKAQARARAGTGEGADRKNDVKSGTVGRDKTGDES